MSPVMQRKIPRWKRVLVEARHPTTRQVGGVALAVGGSAEFWAVTTYGWHAVFVGFVAAQIPIWLSTAFISWQSSEIRKDTAWLNARIETSESVARWFKW